jgi:DNA helicase-2/ATP-dependent DNA helicase PcrA
MKTEVYDQPFSFLDHLNDAQRQAVTAPLGVQLIVAGAGSGKTRVITSRIAYLLSHFQVPAQAIVALTFTNRAGNEMKERIKKHLPHTALPFVGTFHSYCVRLLKQYSHLLPFADFTIIDTEDQRAILKKIMEHYGVDKQSTPAKMQGYISLSKNYLPGSSYNDVPSIPLFQEIAAAYEREKSRSHAYDFDDLMLATLDLLRKHPEVVTHLQKTVRHLLVDEYQDTNQIQHELLKRLAFDASGRMCLESVCAVGDQDQSIYSWRGAQADNMQKFCTDFAPVTTITIDQNYRSVKPILDAANEVIAHNRGRIEKKLWSAKHASGRLALLYAQSGTQEAHVIAHALQVAHKKVSPNECAILYRTHHQSRAIEEALMIAGLPYIIVGGIRFYERKEIKDILAYAKLLINPFDRQSFLRIINVPTRGVGEKCIDIAHTLWETSPEKNCREVLKDLIQNPEYALNKVQRSGLEQLHALLTPTAGTSNLSKILSDIVSQTEYTTYLKKNYHDQELTHKIENVQELLSAVRNFEQAHTGATLSDFLEHVMLMQEQTPQEENHTAEHIKLMTLHGAKGLEFDFVALCGLEEQLFPSTRALMSSADMEEERRLMYVGLTRAREYVLLTHSELRTTYGTSTRQEMSRFVHEIPTHLLIKKDCRQDTVYARGTWLAQWLNVAPSISAPPVKTYAAPAAKKPTSFNTSGRFNNSLSSPTPSAVRSTQPQAAAPSKRAPWLVRMPVKHPTFGVGLIQEIEARGGDEYFLTISFKSGVKKLSSRFVTRS